MSEPFIVLRPDDAASMARLHAQCFPDPWSPASFRTLLKAPTSLALGVSDNAHLAGFSCVQVVGDEAELLTIAVDPDRRREGLGARLLTAIVSRLGERGVDRFMLDVAEDNRPAIGLYLSLGFTEDGRRRGYYSAGREAPVDAVLMSRRLGLGPP